MVLTKEDRERRKESAARRMADNARVNTLTTAQHEALADLASLRHDLHCNWDGIWYGNYSNDLIEWEPHIVTTLGEVGLPHLSLPNLDDLCFADDYYLILGDDERAKWETKAEADNTDNPNRSMSHNGFSYWMEKGWEYQQFCEIMGEFNSAIERYLAKIDSEHGTNYTPTGLQRI